MKLKHYIVPILFLIIAVGNTRAELPYESDQDHTFVVTGGMKEKDPFTDKFQKVFSFNYFYQNKISVGISYRDNIYLKSIYEIGGILNDSGYIENPEGSDQFADRYTYLQRIYSFEKSASYNLYAQVKPLNLLHIKAPVSFSLFVAVQDVSDGKNLIVNGYIYKKFILNQNNSIQPILSIGYGDISSVSGSRRQKYGISLIYAFQLNKQTSILITPEVDRYWFDTNFTV